ncbi:ABC transporter ATP-binding protein [Methylocapsa acidiphila]|uniref:ABC transporter ATP-binding protein n=1 Tax=Methylocapsa acidiphila TaxID=133552 RepID=UPI00040760E6|nr:ABC transporter ATP-binding protein [Methylocapsa acidiphila]
MILRAVGLCKRYGDGAKCEVVRQASLTLGEREFVSIVGPSGSGKSTLLAMIGALAKPTEGQVLLDDQDLWASPERTIADIRCRSMGFVFQFFSLLPNLRAIDNVALPALLGASMAAEDAYARAQALLERVGLSERMSAYPGEMSGGEQRRVAIARALINAPRLLFADEPTSDLDEDTEDDIITLLEELRRETPCGMIIVTHNLELAKRADRMYHMKHGMLYAPTAPLAPHQPSTLSLSPPPVAAAYSTLKQTPVGSLGSDRRENAELFKPAQISISSRGNKAFQSESTHASRTNGARELRQLGGLLPAAAGRALGIAAAIFTLALLGNYSVLRYQHYKIALEQDRLSALEDLATSTLKSEIESISQLGDNHYDVTIYLENTSGDKPLYVLEPSVQAFIQVGSEWREMPLTPIDKATAAVLKVVGRQSYHFDLNAKIDKYAQLLPHYMHVRFTNSMLISPESRPQKELFQRNDNYFIYLKPDNLDDATITKDVRFAGPPPLWIWMPPH